MGIERGMVMGFVKATGHRSFLLSAGYRSSIHTFRDESRMYSIATLGILGLSRTYVTRSLCTLSAYMCTRMYVHGKRHYHDRSVRIAAT